MAINHELKNIIRQIKFCYDLTQGQIADRLAVSNTYLSDVANGRAPFSDVLRSKIYELFSDIEQPTKQHIVYGGQHVQNGDAINGDKIVEEVADVKGTVEEVEKEEINIKKVVECETDRLLALLEANQRSLASMIAQQDRYLSIIENLTKNQKA